jgi:hypothetical protein
MEAPKNKSSRLASTIRWVARILCILAIVFSGIFALEAVEGKVGLGRQILAFLMAPPFLMSVLLIIILIIAWKHELLGGILVPLIWLATAAYVSVSTYHRFLHRASKGFQPGLQHVRNFVAMISLPLIIVCVLFIISYFLHRPEKLWHTWPVNGKGNIDKRARWARILVIIGLVLMVIGVLDPLEGSLIILPGIGLVAISAFLIKSRYQKLLLWAFCLAVVGVGALVILGSLGGFGGKTGLSWVWGLTVLPYPAGWIMGLIGVIRMLYES